MQFESGYHNCRCNLNLDRWTAATPFNDQLWTAGDGAPQKRNHFLLIPRDIATEVVSASRCWKDYYTVVGTQCSRCFNMRSAFCMSLQIIDYKLPILKSMFLLQNNLPGLHLALASQPFSNESNPHSVWFSGLYVFFSKLSRL